MPYALMLLCTYAPTLFLGVEMVKTEKKSKSGLRKKTSTRILKLVLLLIVVLIVLVFLLVPAFMSSEKGRRLILAKINDSIAGQIDFADLSMGWLKGVRIGDFSFNDNVCLLYTSPSPRD